MKYKDLHKMINNGFANLLLNENQLAEALSMSLATVRRWRITGGGPEFLKIGASVRYRPEDVQQFLDELAATGRRRAAE